MARKDRIITAGFYHIINRGVEKRNIFVEPEDYEKFLELMTTMREIFDITIHSYCLMTNHYHLLLQTHDENISDAIKYLNSYYSIYFNKKYKRAGHLWQGRFLSYFLYDDKHFWIVAKYIERNPIKANMVKEVNHYKYQSFFQWKYKATYFNLLENSMIFDMTLKEYETHLSSEFEDKISDKVFDTQKIVKLKDGTIKILYKRLENFFEEDKDINRKINIKKAYEYGYSKTMIADLLGLSMKTISKYI